MAWAIWTVSSAIAAGTAYPIPATALLPAGTQVTSILDLIIVPAAGSTVAPITETAVAPNTTSPGAGTVSLQTTGANAQHLISGDAIPANSLLILNARTPAEGVIQ